MPSYRSGGFSSRAEWAAPERGWHEQKGAAGGKVRRRAHAQKLQPRSRALCLFHNSAALPIFCSFSPCRTSASSSRPPACTQAAASACSWVSLPRTSQQFPSAPPHGPELRIGISSGPSTLMALDPPTVACRCYSQSTPHPKLRTHAPPARAHRRPHRSPWDHKYSHSLACRPNGAFPRLHYAPKR